MVTGRISRKIIWTVGKVLIIILFVLTLMSAYGGYFNPRFWTVPALSVLVFPFFAMGTLLVSVVLLIARKFLYGCIGIGVLMACGPTFFTALPLRFGNSPVNEANTFKMVTFNCLHLQDYNNPNAEKNRSVEFLINSGADFICLQELYGLHTAEIRKNQKSQIDSLIQVYPYYSHDGYREVEFLSKYPFETLDVKLPEIKYGSVGAYRLNIRGHELTVVNVHLPSYRLSDKERDIITEARNRAGMKKSIKEMEGTVLRKMKKAFANRAKVSKSVAEYAASLPGNVIVCGDFNDVPGSWAYRNFTKRDFEDAYAQTGFGHLITYNQHLMLFHIDQILYRGDLAPLYVKKDRMNASDHYPLVAEFEFI